MAQRDDSKEIKEEFLSGYGDGTDFQKRRNKLYGPKVNKELTNVEDVTSDMDKLRNPGKYASDAKNIVMPSPYLSGKVKGASDMAIAIEKEKQYKDAVDYMNPKAKKIASGGAVKSSSASKRADGCAILGKTRA